jgi:phosphoribosyl 1,2-cyclic phosphate phosphodiesterase
MTLRITILGCGASTGVPRVGGDWGACDPANPKNRRRRSSILAERIGPKGTTSVLIDTSPDLREQALSAGITRLDGVIYTHDHADHTHGIDDLRILCYMQKKRMPIWGDPRTIRLLKQRFDYCFVTPHGSVYPPILEANVVEHHAPVTISGPGGDLTFQPFRQIHGNIDTLGLKVGGVVYSCDLNDIPEESLPYLEDLDAWLLNSLRYTGHPSHLSVDKAVSWIERMAPKLGVLTHLHIEIDYAGLAAKLPAGIVPAYDGMVLEFPY